MTIKRGSMTIELSADELRKAHREYESSCHFEDIKAVLENDFEGIVRFDNMDIKKSVDEIGKDAALMEKIKGRYDEYLWDSDDWYTHAVNAIRDCLTEEGLLCHR